MRRGAWLYGVAGFGFYLIFLIVTAPASLMAWILRDVSNDTIHLAAPRGSVWRGYGELVIRGNNDVAVSFGDGRWSLNPLWLGAGQVAVRLHFENRQDGPLQFSGQIRAGFSGLKLHDTRVVFPATLIATVFAPAAFVTPGGTVQLAIGDLQLGRQKIDGAAQLDWIDASSSLSTVRPLGRYRFLLRGEGEVATIDIATVSGDLTLTGKGDWRIVPGQLQLQMSVRPAARVQEFEPLLKLFGKDQGDNTRKIAINTRLAYPWP